MSTVLVSKKHIDVIVTAYLTYEAEADLIFSPSRNKDFNQIGQMLWNENYKSFTSDRLPKLLAPEYLFSKYTTNLWQVYKAIEALDGESRESLSYKKSKAKKILENLKALVIHKIKTQSKEYREAEWLIEEYR